jgi:hypothetical protein
VLETQQNVISAVIVFGSLIVIFSGAIALALDHLNLWRVIKNFILSLTTLIGLAGGRALLGIVYLRDLLNVESGSKPYAPQQGKKAA